MVVNKRSDSQKSNSSVLKKNVIFGLSGRDIPKLENMIKNQFTEVLCRMAKNNNRRGGILP